VTPSNLPAFRRSALVWTFSLSAALAFTGFEIGAVTQTSSTPPAQTGASSAKPSSQTPPTAPPSTAGTRGNTPGQPGQGRGRIGTSVPGQRDGPTWWHDETVKKELALTADQIRRLDIIYERRAKDLDPLREELNKQVAELSRLMSNRNAGTAAIALQVAHLEVPRAKINESFYVMMYRMSLVLDVEQNKKLQAIFDRNRERGRGGEPR
jgi:Spy/CpxP family protein refolding chaperone